MKYQINISPIPSQTFKHNFHGTMVTFWLRQLSTGLYIDGHIGDKYIMASTLCRQKVDLFISSSMPFSGALYFEDTQGETDPYYAELNNRWRLVYHEDEDK